MKSNFANYRAGAGTVYTHHDVTGKNKVAHGRVTNCPSLPGVEGFPESGTFILNWSGSGQARVVIHPMTG